MNLGELYRELNEMRELKERLNKAQHDEFSLRLKMKTKTQRETHDSLVRVIAEAKFRISRMEKIEVISITVS